MNQINRWLSYSHYCMVYLIYLKPCRLLFLQHRGTERIKFRTWRVDFWWQIGLFWTVLFQKWIFAFSDNLILLNLGVLWSRRLLSFRRVDLIFNCDRKFVFKHDFDQKYLFSLKSLMHQVRCKPSELVFSIKKDINFFQTQVSN